MLYRMATGNARGDYVTVGRTAEGTAERWLADRLWPAPRDVLANLYAGRTTPEIRRDRIRTRILELGWQRRRAGYAGDEPETFAEVFERLYGAPLLPTNEVKSDA